MGKTLSQIKREYYQAKTSGTAQTPLEQMERTYNVQQSGQKQPLKQSRLNYLKNIITTHGGTINSTRESDLIIEALASLGIKPTNSKSLNLRLLFQANP